MNVTLPFGTLSQWASMSEALRNLSLSTSRAHFSIALIGFGEGEPIIRNASLGHYRVVPVHISGLVMSECFPY